MDRSYFRFNIVISVLAYLQLTTADIYLHNPRGSNNRLDEEAREVQNPNRMFDSQNNNRGGYNVGGLLYYAGSTLPIEWTNQHSCMNPNAHCELVIQYMCGDLVRDGASRGTIRTENNQCRNNDCNTDFEYGMNENFEYYQNCRYRLRNKGLFIADQNLAGNRKNARNTRQNPTGKRYGYECPEERDYYPYWEPSPWKDIVVMTNDASRCPFYQEESQNVKSRWTCVVPKNVTEKYTGKFDIPNNEADCKAFRYPKNDPNGAKALWTEIASHGIPAPDCRESQFSRDNHLGNGIGGQPLVYNWTIPNTLNHEQCVMRMRYNISTGDYDGWNTSSANLASANEIFYKNLGFSEADAASDRGFVFEDNPEVKLFNDLGFELELAVNTAQYGRTFQDRSFIFAVRPQPSETSGKAIHNLNVRGKRGNIVEVFPSVEYDFVPNNLEAANGDYIHIQWTGSNTNNAGNDGNGQQRSDRNNIVLLNSQVYPEGNGVQFGPGAKYGHYGTNYPMHLDNSTFLGLSREDRESLAFNVPGAFGGELSQLDDSSPYFNLGIRQISQLGTFHYMCTRNNDFSNRDQKGRIMVSSSPTVYESIGWMGGQLKIADSKAWVRVERGTFSKLNTLKLNEWNSKDGENLMKSKGGAITVGDDFASDFIVLAPETKLTDNGKKVTVGITINEDASDIGIYRSNTENFAGWTKVDATINGGMAEFQTDQGGVFVARSHTNIGPIIGVVVGLLVVALIVIAAVVYFKKNPTKWMAMKGNAKYVEKSLSNKV
ncbi:protein DD3-3-like isoform X1 [Mytilus edulis]|uniref:protein DD3-3-like isoform X1 n=2 Tax=Mytilus edulis TaxID=6550 RepID=UPI0039F10A1F